MNHTLFNGMMIACLAGALPMAIEAEEYGVPFNCTITRPRPICTTELRPQRVTVYRDVTETQISQKRVVENVPVTTCRNVTVDEGGYQMVWVPKPVTKQVAQTVIQQQVKTVNVPVQVQRRIPQVATQMVPVQTVQYVNETVPLHMTAMAPACPTCSSGLAGLSQPLYSPPVSYQAPQFQPSPSPMTSIPTMPAIDLPSYQSSLKPSPRRDAAVPLPMMTEEVVRARGVPVPQDEAKSAPRKTSMFQGVPSAASVWRRQDATYAR